MSISQVAVTLDIVRDFREYASDLAAIDVISPNRAA